MFKHTKNYLLPIIAFLVFLIFSAGTTAQTTLIQNIYGRSISSLDGRWNYIIDPYETGFYNYRRMPFDESASGSGGYYDNKKPNDKTEWVEYDFDLSPTMAIPGDFCLGQH